MVAKSHVVGMCIVFVAIIAGLILVPAVQGDRPEECIAGKGYYWESGSGWKPCERCGPSGDYLIQVDCETCPEQGICEPLWYNYPDDGEYVCHLGDVTHIGHELHAIATWTADGEHADVDTTIASYDGGGTWDPHFPLKSGQD
ncbi:MAG: hypothetical protein GF355_03210 [Candidatus Eisenbacteria bacterium]|nr:hypothetical protein [Candidatus Eisenbacteria bacterium]